MPATVAPDPPGATSPSPLPNEEKNDRARRLSTAPTHSSPSRAAGCSHTGTPLLPAAATTTMPAASARRIASSKLSPPPAPDERHLAPQATG